MSYPRQKDPNKCPGIVPTAGMRMNYHQCRGKVIKDGYCRVHHPDEVKARRQASEDRYRKARRQASEDRYRKEQQNSPMARLIETQKKLTIARTALESITHDMGASLQIHKLCAETLELTKS